MQSVSATIASSMDAKGLSVYALARDAGIPRVTLMRRLAKPETFTVSELAAIAVVLDLDLTIGAVPMRISA